MSPKRSKVLTYHDKFLSVKSNKPLIKWKKWGHVKIWKNCISNFMVEFQNANTLVVTDFLFFFSTANMERLAKIESLFCLYYYSRDEWPMMELLISYSMFFYAICFRDKQLWEMQSADLKLYDTFIMQSCKIKSPLP